MVNFEALALLRAIAHCDSHAELDAVAREVRAARGRLSAHEYGRLVHHGEDRREALEAAADMWQDRAMPESPYYSAA